MRDRIDLSHPRRRLLKVLTAAATLPFLQACGSLAANLPANRNNLSRFTDGSDLSIKVFNALKSSPFTSLVNVHIRSIENEIIISGFVDEESDFYNVDQVARAVDGVQVVLMEVIVR